jgi:lipopolysaccharide export system protein LptC
MAVHVYTNRVKFLRGFLPLLAVAALVVVVGWPVYSHIKETIKSKTSITRLKSEEISVTLPQPGKPAQLQVTKPEFTGRDDHNRPYKVTAARVVQDVPLDKMTEGAMQLESPVASISLNEKSNATLQAQNGFYDPKKQTLQLNNDVLLQHSDGYTLRMQDLFVDLVQGSSVTQKPVSGEGPMGQLAAESLELRDKGAHIILHGRSRITLNASGKGLL